MKFLKSPRSLLAFSLITLTFVAALTLAIGFVLTRQAATAERLAAAVSRRHESHRLPDQLRQNSDDLSRMVRSYAATGDRAFAEYFYTILDIRDGRTPRPERYDFMFWDLKITGETLPDVGGGTKISLRRLIEEAGFSDEELQLLTEAKRRSDRLVEIEETAINAVNGRFRDDTGTFTMVADPDRELALRILYDEEYLRAKSAIMRPIDDVLELVNNRTTDAIAAAQREQASLNAILTFLVGGLLFALPLFIFTGYRYHRVSSTELRESEGRFRATFEQAAVGIAHVAPNGDFLRINDRFCEIVGYTRDEMLTRTFQDITHPDDLNADLEHVQRLLRGEVDTYSKSKRYFHKDGQIVWVNLTVSLLRDDTGDPKWFVSVVENITKRKQAENTLLEYQLRLKALASELTVSEEKERRRIALDLHDQVGQSLSFARLQLAAAKKATTDIDLAANLDEISQSLLKAVQDTREIMYDLSSPSIDEIGLDAAISEWMEVRIASRHGLTTEFTADEMNTSLDDDTRAVVFRCVRELLTNVVKHARASRVAVRMFVEADTFRVAVEDDGVGFDATGAADAYSGEGGFGLFSIHERMGDLGGELEIESRPGAGCTAVLRVPIEPL